MNPEHETSVDAGNPALGRRYRVVADYQVVYSDPISVGVGETFQVSEKVDHWNNNPDWVWIWCTDQRGKQGWVPKKMITFNLNDGTGTVRYPYTARELTVAAGEELDTYQEESGWVWCTNRQGESGWVPLEHLMSLTVE